MACLSILSSSILLFYYYTLQTCFDATCALTLTNSQKKEGGLGTASAGLEDDGEEEDEDEEE